MNERERRRRKGVELERRVRSWLERQMIPVEYVAPERGWPSDGGFDLIAGGHAYQCKNHARPVGLNDCEQALVRYETSDDAELLIIVSPSGFTDQFKRWVMLYDPQPILWDGKIIQELGI